MEGISKIKNLSKKKSRAIIALLHYKTVAEAALAVGIGETTLFRWLQDPAFKDAYREAKYEVVQQALSQLQKASSEAVEVLQNIMRDEGASPHTRVTAARIILETSIKAVEIDTLETRLEVLEEHVEEQFADEQEQKRWHH
ncbi:phBC6A51 family helix-turn-helix protein [Candidatus Zixiibacteriota bacterium]